MRKKKIKLPIYSGTLIIIETNDFHKLNPKYNLNLEDASTCDAFVFKRTTKKGYTQHVVVFSKNIKRSIVVHEVCHLVNDIFKNLYIKLDIDNDEPQAYLMGWLFEQCDKFLSKSK